MNSSKVPIYCVSLSDRMDRREAMLKLGLSKAFEFKFFDAVDGRNGKVAIPNWIAAVDEHRVANPDNVQFPSLNGRWTWGQVTEVERACLLSHMSIWRMIVAHGTGGGIILEDDVMANGELDLAELNVAVKAGLAKYDLLYLGYSSNLEPVRGDFSLSKLRSIFSRLLQPSVEKEFAFSRRYGSCVGSEVSAEGFRKSGLHFGTYAYAVSVEGAKQLLQICSRVDIAADRALQCYVMLGSKAGVFDIPPFVTNDDFGSDIQDEAKFKKDVLNNPQKRVVS